MIYSVKITFANICQKSTIITNKVKGRLLYTSEHEKSRNHDITR